MVQVEKIDSYKVLKAILNNLSLVNGADKLVIAVIDNNDFYQIVDKNNFLLIGFSLELAIKNDEKSVHLTNYKCGSFRNVFNGIKVVYKIMNEIKTALDADKISTYSHHKGIRFYLKNVLKLKQDDSLFYEGR